MGTESENGSCCGSSDKETACCKVESVVSIDERGQMVLPKDIRDRAGIGAGDKLAVV
ncbi:MAG: AbrB/MazE/SpoVT family DNA-binding domain-containing protein, partial [Candidatus Thermoplasmatota archaeon]|nr:AbrB/MazE/SpoVT family DNA-binding domain-containing protein [Candidatus Thermoplasmatota archaeon]